MNKKNNISGSYKQNVFIPSLSRLHPLFQMLSMGSSPSGHPKGAPSVCRAHSSHYLANGFVPSENVESLQLYPFLEQKAAFVRHEAKPQVGTHFLFLFFLNVKNAVVQCGEKKLKRLAASRRTTAIQAKRKPVADAVGVRARVRARSCCVSVKWSLSDTTCLVVCHCCGCLGGCRWSCCRFVILPLIVSRVPI